MDSSYEMFVEDGSVCVPFRIRYSRGSVPSVSEVVDSLIGVESIAKRLPKVVSALVGVPVSDAVVSVNSVKTGILYDDLVVKFVFGGQEQMDLFLKDMHMKFMDHKAIPVLAFVALVSFGAYGVFNLFGDKSNSSNVVNSYNNNVVNVISLDSGKSVEDVEKILKSVSAGTSELRLAKDSLKVLSAARAGGDFSVDGAPPITSDVVSSIPSWSDVEEVDEIVKLQDVAVNVRSMDLDSDKRGWSVVIPSIGDGRLKMNLDDGVERTAVVPGKLLKADVSVYYKVHDGEKVAYRCVMHSVK